MHIRFLTTAISCARSEQFLLKHLILWKKLTSWGKPYTWSKNKILHPSFSDVVQWDCFILLEPQYNAWTQSTKFGGRSTSEGSASLANRRTATNPRIPIVSVQQWCVSGTESGSWMKISIPSFKGSSSHYCPQLLDLLVKPTAVNQRNQENWTKGPTANSLHDQKQDKAFVNS